MSVYFASDLHLGHKLASKLRGFESVEEHDESVIESLINYCDKRTLLWILGDVAFTDEALEKLSALPCRMKMVRGNHDQSSMDKYSMFEEIHGFLKYKDLWLSHCPIHPQEMWRCDANVHGHIHKGAATPELDFPYINVNWDFWGRPVSLEEIRGIVKCQEKNQFLDIPQFLRKHND